MKDELAQSGMGCKSAKETCLVDKIDNSVREVNEGLLSIESMVENINERLLPSREKLLSKEDKDEKTPDGWLETHLADLHRATTKIIRIVEKLRELSRETKTELK